MKTATLLTESLPGWAPGTRHYAIDDGKYLAVEVDVIPDGTLLPIAAAPFVGEIVVSVGGDFLKSVKYISRQTTVFLCGEHGEPVSDEENGYDPMLPLRIFPAGLNHEDALAAMGYSLA